MFYSPNYDSIRVVLAYSRNSSNVTFSPLWGDGAPSCLNQRIGTGLSVIRSRLHLLADFLGCCVVVPGNLLQHTAHSAFTYVIASCIQYTIL